MSSGHTVTTVTVTVWGLCLVRIGVRWNTWAQWGQAPLRPRGQVLAEVVKGFLQLAVFGLGEAGFLAVYLIAVQVLLMLGLCQRLCAMGAKCQALLRPFHCSEKSDSSDIY